MFCEEKSNSPEQDKSCFIKVKKLSMVMFSLFLAVLVIFFVVKIINEIETGKYIGQDIAPLNTINVSGKGEIFIKPDIAKISLSVEKEAVAVVDAQRQAAEAMNKTILFLKNSSIEEKDIKTTGYNIYPHYDYLENQGRVFRGYTVSQSLEVKIRKIEDAGKILAGVAEAGANQVGGVSFVVDKEDDAKREARQKAITDAKQKAEDMAKDLGVKIIRLVSFSESGGNAIMPYYKADSGTGMGGSFEPPELPVGENNIVSNVSLTFEIK